MSYWVSKMKCKKCGAEVNVTGGMVQTTWMGPTDEEMKCPNKSCDGQGFKDFQAISGWPFEYLICKTCGFPVGISECCSQCGSFNLVKREDVGPPTFPGRMA